MRQLIAVSIFTQRGNHERPTMSNIFQYFKDARAELGRVTWPSREQVIEGTQAVLVFVIALTVVVYLYDLIFGNLIKLVLP
jgi:preprotein translocase subunit SecE